MVDLSGGVVLGICAAQLVAGVLKAISVNIFVFLLFGGAQVAGVGIVAYHTFDAALPSLTAASGASGADLVSSAALAYVVSAATSCFITLVDVLMSAAYVFRGLPTDDVGACFKVMVLFSMAGFVVEGASLVRIGFRVEDIDIVPLGNSAVMSNVALLVTYIGLGIAAAGMLLVSVLNTINLVSRVGNRRFALAWGLCLFLVVIPVGVLLGVGSILGDSDGPAGGLLYIAVTVYLPLMSFAFTLTKESFVLEKVKDGKGNSFVYE